MISILSFLVGVFGMLRFLQEPRGLNSADIFKDLAHLYVGGLFGAAAGLTYIINKYPNSDITKHLDIKRNCIFLWVLAVSLTILEVVAFLTMK